MSYNESAYVISQRQQKANCFEMGYTEEDVNEAINELLNQGLEKPSLEDILDIIEGRGKEDAIKGESSSETESLLEENRRLKSIVYCMICQKNNVSALFLPCTHNELCITCAESLDSNCCPVCQEDIREKIHTYMA